jgi:hypothetical protein
LGIKERASQDSKGREARRRVPARARPGARGWCSYKYSNSIPIPNEQVPKVPKAGKVRGKRETGEGNVAVFMSEPLGCSHDEGLRKNTRGDAENRDVPSQSHIIGD